MERNKCFVIESEPSGKFIKQGIGRVKKWPDECQSRGVFFFQVVMENRWVSVEKKKKFLTYTFYLYVRISKTDRN